MMNRSLLSPSIFLRHHGLLSCSHDDHLVTSQRTCNVKGFEYCWLHIQTSRMLPFRVMMMSINHKTISVSLLLLQEQIQGPFCKNGFWVFFVLEFQSILYKFIFCVWVRMVFGFSLFSSFNPFCVHCLYVRMVFGFFFCCWASIHF